MGFYQCVIVNLPVTCLQVNHYNELFCKNFFCQRPKIANLIFYNICIHVLTIHLKAFQLKVMARELICVIKP